MNWVRTVGHEILRREFIMQFCNLNYNLLCRDDLFTRKENELKVIVTVNAQFIVLANTDKRYFDFINAHYATFDGEIPLKFAKKKCKEFSCAEKLSGSEIIYDFAQFAKENGMKLFLLGGKPLSNDIAVQKLREKYDILVEGFSPKFEEYPFSEEFVKTCLDKIADFHPDILFVGFGAPKQEYFIEDNFDFLKSCGVKYAVGCGGTFEFVSGELPRAPRCIQKIGLESLFRFFTEISWMRFSRILYSLKFFRYINGKPKFDNA